MNRSRLGWFRPGSRLRLSERVLGCQGERFFPKVVVLSALWFPPMALLLCILAVAMIVTGSAAMLFGMSIVQVERGWTMVISGTVGAAGGAVLLGIALAAQRLGRIASETVWIRDRLSTIGELTAAEAAWSAPPEAVSELHEEPAEEPVPAPVPPPPPPPPPPARPVPQAAAERVVVGQYSSGGNEYKMFSDGSIDALTPAGLRRFASLEDLRAFVAGGGERAG